MSNCVLRGKPFKEEHSFMVHLRHDQKNISIQPKHVRGTTEKTCEHAGLQLIRHTPNATGPKPHRHNLKFKRNDQKKIPPIQPQQWEMGMGCWRLVLAIILQLTVSGFVLHDSYNCNRLFAIHVNTYGTHQTLLNMADTSSSAQSQVNDEWNSMAGTWDDLASGYAAGLHSILWSNLGMEEEEEEGGDRSTLTVLDFGCGTGLLTDRLRPQVGRVVAVDAAPKMIELLQDKIETREWNNVTAISGILAHAGTSRTTSSNFDDTIKSLEGKVDVIVASSVMNFIPEEDLEATCQALGRLLKPNGKWLHVDWPAGEGQPANGMTLDKVRQMHAAANCTTEQTHEELLLQMGPQDSAKVFLAVAIKNT